MSKEVIEALESGELDPVIYWARHVSSWANIKHETPLDDVQEMYDELMNAALDVTEFLAFLIPAPVASAA